MDEIVYCVIFAFSARRLCARCFSVKVTNRFLHEIHDEINWAVIDYCEKMHEEMIDWETLMMRGS